MKKYVSRSYWLDQDIERVLGNMLRFGVVLSAVVTAIGGILYVIASGGTKHPGFTIFAGKSGESIRIKDILIGASRLQSHSIMLLGVLLLIATPVMRVVFSFFAFLLERDYLYVALTLVVLCIIGLSVLGGFA